MGNRIQSGIKRKLPVFKRFSPWKPKGNVFSVVPGKVLSDNGSGENDTACCYCTGKRFVANAAGREEQKGYDGAEKVGLDDND